ncbi:MAG: DUF1800 domain-containing protein [Gemmatimonadaceae bacterium]
MRELRAVRAFGTRGSTLEWRTMRGAIVLTIGAVLSACAGGKTPVATTPATASQPRELTPDEQARQVLNRLAFGPRPGDVERVKSIGVDRWIAEQLAPDRISDAGMERVLAAFPTRTMSAGELLSQFPPPGAQVVAMRLRGDTVASRADSAVIRERARKGRRFVADVLSARVARAVGSERQMQEVMTDFWLNHFNVFVGKGQLRYYLSDYERDAVRPHVLGHFRDLLGAVAKSPAMLMYLDNAQSVADSTRPTLAGNAAASRMGARRGRFATRRGNAGAPNATRTTNAGSSAPILAQLQARRPRGINENYARELLELHTLGVDGGYTQQDIQEVARAFTGWTIRPPRFGGGTFLFNPRTHDAGSKVILGHSFKGGRGIEDGEDVLDIVARHPSTARFIARKLAVRLVSDTPPGVLVERAAEVFRRTDGDIRAVVKSIVTSPEFFSRAAYRSKVKSPFEVVVSSARALGAAPDTTAVSALAVARLGQPIFGHQAPNGWPETGDAWMNTGAILARINFGLSVSSNRLPGARLRDWADYDRLARQSREAQVDGVIGALLAGAVSPERRSILLTGENPMMPRGSAAAGDSSAADSEGDEVMDGGAVQPGVGGPPQIEDSVRSRARADRRNAPMRTALLARANRPLPPLAGLDQIIGLALGSPEFQRR